MKLGQLIEFNLRNSLLETSYIKCGGETILRPLLRKTKLSISLDQKCKVLHDLILLFGQLRTIKID